MIVLTVVGYAITYGTCAVVSWFCLAHLVKKSERLSLREFSAFRLVPGGFFLALSIFSALYARRSELVCDRSPAGTICSIEQQRALESFHRTLPAGALRGGTVEERVSENANGDLVDQTRLVLTLDDGPYVLTDWGQGDDHERKTQLDAFLGGAGKPHLAIGQDSRWFFYSAVPTWLLVALFFLLVR